MCTACYDWDDPLSVCFGPNCCNSKLYATINVKRKICKTGINFHDALKTGLTIRLSTQTQSEKILLVGQWARSLAKTGQSGACKTWFGVSNLKANKKLSIVCLTSAILSLQNFYWSLRIETFFLNFNADYVSFYKLWFCDFFHRLYYILQKLIYHNNSELKI